MAEHCGKTLHTIQMKIKPRPALYFLIPYLFGIIAGKWVSLPFLWLWIFVLLCFIGSMVTRNRQRFLCYALLHLSIFAGGMLTLSNRLAFTNPNPLLQRADSFLRHSCLSTRTWGGMGCLLCHR